MTKKTFKIPLILLNREFTITFKLTLWDINLKGRSILNNLIILIKLKFKLDKDKSKILIIIIKKSNMFHELVKYELFSKHNP